MPDHRRVRGIGEGAAACCRPLLAGYVRNAIMRKRPPFVRHPSEGWGLRRWRDKLGRAPRSTVFAPPLEMPASAGMTAKIDQLWTLLLPSPVKTGEG